MDNWLYTAWFRDNNLQPDEEDYEWCACMVIEADTDSAAKEWGDKLSVNYTLDNENENFLHSDVEPFEETKDLNTDGLPFLKYGQSATNRNLGL